MFGELLLFSGFDRRFSSARRRTRIFFIAGGLLGAAGLTGAAAAAYLISENALLCLLLAAATAVCVWLSVVMLRRSDYGAEMTGRLLGLRRSLEAVKKERIEMELSTDGFYFYHMLPYAYVFGIEELWAKRFEGLLSQPPGWYKARGYSGAFMPYLFISSCHRCAHTINSSISIPPISESSNGGFSSGGFTGGGFSGGGFSGGGGGSW